MTKAKDLVSLSKISQLILDVKLAGLHSAAKKRQHSLDLLAQINRPVPLNDLSVVIAHQMELRYQAWAELRRGEINLVLARQTADLLAAREDAGQAFGRNQAVNALKEKEH